MADVKISQLASAGVPETTAVLPIVSGGTTKKVSLGAIAEALGVDVSVVKTVNTTTPITGGPIFSTGSIGILEATPNGTRGTMSAADKAKLDAATSSNAADTLVIRSALGAFNGGVITATSFVGPLTGAVTGNVVGNVTGNTNGVHTGSVTGNASTATTLLVSRSISTNGDITGTATNFDGSANIVIPTAIVANAVTTAKIADGAVTVAKLDSNAVFAPGTRLIFQQTSAPTGWTKDTGYNDRTLRVVSGAASAGGSTGFSSVFTSRTPAGSVSISNVTGSVSVTGVVGDTTLTIAQIPSHFHQQRHGQGLKSAGGDDGNRSAGNPSVATNGNTLETGGGQAHNHSWSQTSGSFTGSASGSFSGSAMDFAVAYVDVIVAQKN